MDDDSPQYTVASTPDWSRRFKAVAVTVGGLTVVCLLVAGVLWLQNLGAASNKWLGGGKDKPRRSKFEKMQDRQLLRCGLQEVDQRAERIWEDIAELEREINGWRRQYDSLKTSETGRRLIEDERMVRYYHDFGGYVLPHHKLAEHSRVRLNTLMATVIQALEEEKGYTVNEPTMARIHAIERDVRNAKEEYSFHRHLLEGRAREVGDGGQRPPETLQEAARRHAQKESQKKFGYRSTRQDKNGKTVEPSGQPAEKPTETQPRNPKGDLEEISRNIDGTQAEPPKDSGLTLQTGERGTSRSRSASQNRPE